MTATATTHINFRGNARAALEFYCSALGGDLVVVTFRDMGVVEDPAAADEVMWGQIAAPSGARVMAFDVPRSRPWNPGENAFFIALRSTDPAEITAAWDGLSDGAAILHPIGPAAWSPLYGMLRDRFGVTWVLDVEAGQAPA